MSANVLTKKDARLELGSNRAVLDARDATLS